MSSIRLKTKEDIRSFFKILAEESVKDARLQLLESQIYDPAAERLESQSQLDKKAYSTLKEEEEEEESSVDMVIDPSGEQSVEMSSEEEVTVDTPPQESPDIQDVSLDSINKKIKIMRSGLSVDDTSVQDPMRTYFDLLSDAERKALYAFLNAIASMMTGASGGEDASDPSDPPYNVQMSTSDTEEFEPEEEEEEVVVSSSEEVEEESDEDVPIRVGSVQAKGSISEIRKKVLDLLGKS